MTPQELKASILQLAIQGKLVEQRPEEGTAAELLEKILATKNTKGAKKNLTRSRGARGEKATSATSASPRETIPDDEKPFDIPESWEWVRLGDVVSNHGQKKPTGDFSYIDIGSIDNKNQRLSNDETIVHAENASPRARKIVQKGDVIYATVRPYLHNVCVIDREFSREPIASTGFAVMACADCLDNKYLFYFLLSPDFDRYANSSENAKGVAYPAISDKRLYNAAIPLPPLAEQKRIVAKIEELLPYIDRYEKAWSKLEDFNKRFPGDMQKSLLQMAIQGKFVDQRPEEGTGEELYRQIQTEKQRLIKSGKIKKEKPLPEITPDEIPFDIPESWVWVKLDEILSTKPANGLSPKSVDYPTPYRNLTLTATTSGIFKSDAFKYVDISDELAEKYYLEDDDILIQRSNSREFVGTSCIYRHGNKQYIYPDLMMRLRLIVGINVDFVDYVLKSPLCRSYYRKAASGTSESMPKINQTTVRNTIIPLPPLAEQKRIVAKLEEILPLCERLKG